MSRLRWLGTQSHFYNNDLFCVVNVLLLFRVHFFLGYQGLHLFPGQVAQWVGKSSHTLRECGFTPPPGRGTNLGWGFDPGRACVGGC